jgi:hypothetical protein
VQAWKRNAKLVILHELKADGSIKSARIIASTDLKMDGGCILLAYHSRFQIELLYRDAKQHLGLTHCQALCKRPSNPILPSEYIRPIFVSKPKIWKIQAASVTGLASWESSRRRA